LDQANSKVVLDRDDMRRTLVRIAHEIVERDGGADLALVGIHRRGAVLAAVERLRRLQTGYVVNYALTMLAGAVIFVAYFLWR